MTQALISESVYVNFPNTNKQKKNQNNTRKKNTLLFLDSYSNPSALQSDETSLCSTRLSNRDPTVAVQLIFPHYIHTPLLYITAPSPSAFASITFANHQVENAYCLSTREFKLITERNVLHTFARAREMDLSSLDLK